MGYAQILTTAYVANTSGGTFADSLAANSGDNLSVNQFTDGGARMIYAWGIDSDTACEFSYYFTRPESTHDQNYGIRAQVPALYPGGAGAVGAHNILPGNSQVPCYSGDTLTIKVTSTAADDVLFSYIIEYDDLSGMDAYFISYDQAVALRTSQFGNYVNPTGGTAGVYGTGRALNADDDRFFANKWYGLMGFTTQKPFTTLALSGPTTGGQKIGAPAGVSGLDTTWWFAEESIKRGKPMIPVFGQADAKNISVYVADGEASTAPKVDFHYFEFDQQPVKGA